MFKFIFKPLQILKLSFVISVAQKEMLWFNVLIFVSMGVLAAAAHKSEENLCTPEIFGIFFLKQYLLVSSTVCSLLAFQS